MRGRYSSRGNTVLTLDRFSLSLDLRGCASVRVCTFELSILLINLSAEHNGYELLAPGLYLSYNDYLNSLN